MRITVNSTYLTSEQVKCLSQLGEFRGERTWEAACDPDTGYRHGNTHTTHRIYSLSVFRG